MSSKAIVYALTKIRDSQIIPESNMGLKIEFTSGNLPDTLSSPRKRKYAMIMSATVTSPIPLKLLNRTRIKLFEIKMHPPYTTCPATQNPIALPERSSIAYDCVNT